MTTPFTSAGTKVFVSATLPATYTVVGFKASPVVFTEVKHIADVGEVGREYNLVTFNPVADRRTIKRKGSYNDGALTLNMAYVKADPGQVILRNAVASDNSVSVKVEMKDGTILYFTAQAMGNPYNIGSVDQITSSTVNLEIDNDILVE